MYLKEHSYIVDGSCTFVPLFTENPDCNKYICWIESRELHDDNPGTLLEFLIHRTGIMVHSVYLGSKHLTISESWYLYMAFLSHETNNIRK